MRSIKVLEPLSCCICGESASFMGVVEMKGGGSERGWESLKDHLATLSPEDRQFVKGPRSFNRSEAPLCVEHLVRLSLSWGSGESVLIRRQSFSLHVAMGEAAFA